MLKLSNKTFPNTPFAYRNFRLKRILRYIKLNNSITHNPL